MDCKNCGTLVEDKFCPKCGQNINEKRLDLGFFFEILNKKYNPIKENKSLYSFFLKPKTTILNYLDCKRVDVLDPVAILFLSVGLTILLDGFLKKYMPPKVKSEVDNIEIWVGLQNMYNQNAALFSFLIIIPVSLLTWYFLKKKKFNLAEHIAINSYLSSYSFILTMAITLINFVEIKKGYNHNFSQALSLVLFFYIAFIFSQIIDGKFTFSTFMKYSIANFIFYFFGVIFIVIFVLSSMS